MSAGKRVDGPELLLGLLALAASAGYLYEASQIPESLLADPIGARGVPIAIGWVLAAVGLILCVRSALRRVPANTESASDTAGDAPALTPHVLALGLLAILAVYLLILPHGGYIASTALLIGAIARFAGAPFGRTPLFVAIGGSLVLWLLFDPMLGISLPVGALFGGS